MGGEEEMWFRLESHANRGERWLSILVRLPFFRESSSSEASAQDGNSASQRNQIKLHHLS
jgi:hypothetical protein